jgi:hypothetical protein
MPQNRQLLRQVRRLHADLGQDLRHRVLTLAEQLQHPDPHRMPQGFEEVGLGLTQRRTRTQHFRFNPPTACDIGTIDILIAQFSNQGEHS